MAAHDRILLLGPTGVDKAHAVKRLSDCALVKHGQKIDFVDFESEYLKHAIRESGVHSFTTYLAQDGGPQSRVWRSAWDEYKGRIGGGTTVLALHATYVSNVVGLRCPVNIPAICESFAPTLIVTLIDDVQSMWMRTEIRADGRDERGRPTMEQLLSARRAEQLLGDMLVTHLGGRNARHIVVAASNALVALVNLIVFNADVTYLSFPISAARRMLDAGDTSFFDQINEFHRLALAEMSKNGKRTFVTPLAIDELPMKGTWERNGGKAVIYNDVRDRWAQRDLWGDTDAAILPASGKDFEIPSEQIKDAAGIIGTDLGWRDRRLVLQSRSLAICCPKDPTKDRITRGVKSEIESATLVGIPSFYWQNPRWDPHKFVENEYPAAGSMGIGATELLVKPTESLESLIQSVP